jgi:hypothetical protein
MIEVCDDDEFRLSCDYCGEACDEAFESFEDAVDYKVDRDNHWASVKDKNNEWHELCPACNTPEIIAQLRGHELPDTPRDESSAIELALKALEDF